jgi:hypothetical protein
METLDSFIPNRCKYCEKTNVPHDEHWRYCETCKKMSFFNYAKWNPNMTPITTTCCDCGNT